jgi:hypothetical protein
MSTNLFGKYRGQVIDNLDPEQIGRLLVSVWLRCHPNHFLLGRFSSSATQSNSCLTTGLSGKPLAVSIAFASSGVSLAN